MPFEQNWVGKDMAISLTIA